MPKKVTDPVFAPNGNPLGWCPPTCMARCPTCTVMVEDTPSGWLRHHMRMVHCKRAAEAAELKKSGAGRPKTPRGKGQG